MSDDIYEEDVAAPSLPTRPSSVRSSPRISTQQQVARRDVQTEAQLLADKLNKPPQPTQVLTVKGSTKRRAKPAPAPVQRSHNLVFAVDFAPNAAAFGENYQALIVGFNKQQQGKKQEETLVEFVQRIDPDSEQPAILSIPYQQGVTMFVANGDKLLLAADMIAIGQVIDRQL